MMQCQHERPTRQIVSTQRRASREENTHKEEALANLDPLLSSKRFSSLAAFLAPSPLALLVPLLEHLHQSLTDRRLALRRGRVMCVYNDGRERETNEGQACSESDEVEREWEPAA